MTIKLRTRTIPNGDSDIRVMSFGLDIIIPFLTVLFAIGSMWLSMSLKVDRQALILENSREALPRIVHEAIRDHDEEMQYITRPEFETHDHHGMVKQEGAIK